MINRSIRDGYDREDELSDGRAKRAQYRRMIEDLWNSKTPPPISRRTGNVHAHGSVGRDGDDRKALPEGEAKHQSYSRYLATQDLAEKVKAHQQEKAAAVYT